MIHPALILLIKLNIRGGLRRMLRKLNRPRGLLVVLFQVLLLGSWLTMILMAGIGSAFEQFAAIRGAAAEVIPLGLMLFSLLIVAKSSGESAIYFTPSEVDFLFAGPFSRRELLAFKLWNSILQLLFASLMASVFFIVVAEMWIAAYVGTALSLLLLQLLGMAVALIAQRISQQFYSFSRKALAAIVLAMLAAGFLQGLRLGMQQDVWQLLRSFRESWSGMILLAPFEVFSRTILAERLLPDLLLWGGLALTIDLVLVAVVLRLDANYLEASVALSEKMYRRLEQMQRGGLINALGTPRVARWKLPRFPWLGGAGPIAWRQLTVILRTSRKALVFVVLMALAMGATPIITMARNPPDSAAVAMLVIGATGYLTFFIMLLFPHEVNHIEWLKTLPLRSTAIAWGELCGVVLIVALLQTFIFCAVSFWVTESAGVLLLAAVFTIPANLVILGVGRLIFLLYPSRLMPQTPGDFQHVFGRNAVSIMMKCLGIAVCFALAGGFGGIAYLLSGLSSIAFAAVGWLALLLEGIGIMHLNAWAFRRFDPSVDIPP